MREENPKYKTKNVFEKEDDNVPVPEMEVIEIGGVRYQVIGISLEPYECKPNDDTKKEGE